MIFQILAQSDPSKFLRSQGTESSEKMSIKRFKGWKKVSKLNKISRHLAELAGEEEDCDGSDTDDGGLF